MIGRLRREERGFTLIELLVASTLMIVVLSATLTTLDSAGTNRVRHDQQNDSQDLARTTLDLMSGQIRNLASPSASALKTIDVANSYELIFQTTDPSKRWVRYCLSNSGTYGGVASSAGNATLWYQTPNAAFLAQSPAKAPSQQTSPATMTGLSAGCPTAPTASGSPGWASATVVARHVTNKIGAQDRPVFTYNAPNTDTTKITNVYVQLFVDYDTTRKPGEVKISTGDYLRNQNEAPIAVLTFTGAQNQRSWQFNATNSSDPEGRTLSFLYYKTTAATPDTTTMPDCQTPTTQIANGWTCIGEGPVLNYTFPNSDTGVQKVYLKVTDPGLLSAFADSTSGCPCPPGLQVKVS
jgi:prepilin-type N-terminal cleavage/methylation domain-containing protein